MKPLLFMITMTLVGTVGVFFSPFCGVAVYYLFAVLRPQYIWHWALPIEIPWSMFVAVGTIVGAVVHLLGMSPASATGAMGSTATVRRVYSRAHGAMLLFALWVAMTYVTAQDREAAWPWFIEYLKIFLMFFVSALLIRTLRHVWTLLIIAALALGYIAYEVNFLYFFNHYLGIYHSGYGGLDNNGAGLILAMGVPLCLFIWMGTTRWWRWAFAALIPFLLHAVLMTYSRGAMISLLLAAPLMFLRGRHRFQLAVAATAILLVVPILAGREIRDEFLSVERYQQDSSAQARFSSWEAAFRIALDYPVLGVGVRNANLFSFAYGADQPGRAIHSQFLQILADNGFPGLAFYLLTFVFVLLSLRKVRRWARHHDSEEARLAYAIACGVESSLGVFCAGAMFLSLEVVELPFLLLLIGAQLPLALGAQAVEAPAQVGLATAAASAARNAGARPLAARTGARI